MFYHHTSKDKTNTTPPDGQSAQRVIALSTVPRSLTSYEYLSKVLKQACPVSMEAQIMDLVYASIFDLTPDQLRDYLGIPGTISVRDALQQRSRVGGAYLALAEEILASQIEKELGARGRLGIMEITEFAISWGKTFRVNSSHIAAILDIDLRTGLRYGPIDDDDPF